MKTELENDLQFITQKTQVLTECALKQSTQI